MFFLLLCLFAAVEGMTKGSMVTKGVIVGGGRIGSLIWTLNGQQDRLLKRDEKLTAEETGPVYVCTRNSDLENIIETCPANRREDLVFLQNGVLTEYLESKGLEGNTQGLIYFAVSKKGEKPIDGITDVNPEGLTAITGKWGEDFRARLAMGGLRCHVLDKPTWTVAMLEKHIWICAFMAVGAKYKGITVGEVEREHNAEVRSLIAELAAAATLKTKVAFPAGVADRLCAYARSVAHFPTALKEIEWRNGWFTDITYDQASKLQPDPLPQHTAIMSSQRLLFPARKRWVAKMEERSKTQSVLIRNEREADRARLGEISRQQRLERLDEAQRRAQRGERDIPPLTTSPTILLKNQDSPRVKRMLAEHEATMLAIFEREDREEQQRNEVAEAIINAGEN